MAEDSIERPPAWWCYYHGLKGTNWTTLTPPKTDLRGKWVIITGANNGIGLEAAKTLAQWGANIILGCREPPKWEHHPTEAVEECMQLAASAGHSSTIEWWSIDMADLDTVDSFAQRWLDTGRPLDILFNNAGMAPHQGEMHRATKDGFQIVHQVNLLSHILLTYRLLDSLAQTAEPRIVCTTSCIHFRGIFNPDNMNDCSERAVTERGDYYNSNKLYFQCWVAEMQRRFLTHNKYRHITINGVNPGFVNSGLWKFSATNNGSRLGATIEAVFGFLVGNFGITPAQGSVALINAGTNPAFGPNPDLQGRGEPGSHGGGHYINRIWPATPMPYVEHSGSRLKVWNKLTEELRSVRKDLKALDELDV